MSTVIFQGLQPSLESHSHHVESTTMRLKLVAPKTLELNRGFSRDIVPKENKSEKCHNDDFGGWHFLQSLSSQTPKKALDTESSYIVNQSSLLRLTDKSLEICTESLGSETGSDTSESSVFSLSSWDSMNEKSSPREERNLILPQMESRKVISRDFPPPLTTISGSNSLRVRPHREGGRLIIQAEEAPSGDTYLQAERSEGRLRLSFWKNVDYGVDSERTSEEDEHAEDDVENDLDLEDEFDEEEEDEEGNGEVVVEKDIDGNSYDVEVGMGMRMGMAMKKFQRLRRCKENAHGDKGRLCKWEVFWVATS